MLPILYAIQPMENHRRPSPDDYPYRVTRNKLQCPSRSNDMYLKAT
jgi:hypothetical protein